MLAATLFAIVGLAGSWQDLQGGESSTPSEQRFEFTEPQMGVSFTLTFYATSEESATKAAKAAFERIEQLNGLLSDYDPESELSRLSAGSPHESEVVVSEDLWKVLKAAQQMSRQTDGAFDVTVGPLTRLWRRARRKHEMPARERLDPALAAVGYQSVQLDPENQTVRLKKANMRLDLGGIAKGYAADEALRVLANHGVKQALVDASGDVALGDPPPGEIGWSVGIAPLEPDGPPSIRIKLANCAIATSGDAWQHIEIDGVRYSHIVDPKTGLGLTHQGGVTVIGPNAMTADAWASAVSVLGAERGVRLAELCPDVEAMFVSFDQKGDVIKRHTKEFPKTEQESRGE